MPSTIVQLQIPACVDGAELSGHLACSEFLGLWEHDGVLTIYWQGTEMSLRQCLSEALASFTTPIAEEEIQVQLVQHQDWNAQWAASVKPIRIGRRIGIRPSWESVDLPAGGIEIVLDPKQAFGTGHHATTHLLLEWLEQLSDLENCRVFDVGTGSGILSMVALRLGAVSALAIDCDPVAIDCAKEYALINGFADELDIRCCRIDDLTPQAFEVIVANIDRKTILSISPNLRRFRASSTQLFLSGLLQEDEAEITDRMTTEGWRQKAIRERDGWIALQFGVRPSP